MTKRLIVSNIVPAKLFHSRNIYNSVMQVVDQLRHISIKESFVLSNGIPSKRTIAGICMPFYKV